MTYPNRPNRPTLGQLPPHTGTPLPGDDRGRLPLPGLDAEDQSAYDVMVAMLREWGLESLAAVIRDYLIEGYTQDQISILIQDSDTYKTRFAGNEARRKAGLPALDPRSYLEVESSYRRIMSAAGLPSGFYDSPDDFSSWIGADVSPQEIQNRVGLAVDAAQRLDEGTRAAFRDWYGVNEAGLAAFFLDRERAEPMLQRISRGVRLGGGLRNQGLGMTRERADQLSAYLDAGGIDAAVASIAEATRAGTRLGSIYNVDYTQADAEDEIVMGSEAAKRRRRELAAQEVGTFSGSSAVGQGSLKQPTSKNI